MTRRCSVCEEEKEASEFHRDKTAKDGLSRRCKECAIRAARLWYAQNRERVHKSSEAWREANPDVVAAMRKRYKRRHRDKINAYRRAVYAEHPEKRRRQQPEVWRRRYANHREEILQYSAKWRRRNPDLWAATIARRRKRLAEATVNDFTAQQWRFLLALYRRRCAYCWKHSTRLTQDHVIPVSHGGNHTIGNIVPACDRCNRMKHVKSLSDFLAERLAA